ncbi:hypothetical protein [Paraburkholderia ferrariae]|uniref:Uncharacterized protein n=1 Tax=Paraburkholderia ferrariae TaxID=386056 RepID=A0ABU9RYF6_9BURK
MEFRDTNAILDCACAGRPVTDSLTAAEKVGAIAELLSKGIDANAVLSGIAAILSAPGTPPGTAGEPLSDSAMRTAFAEAQAVHAARRAEHEAMIRRPHGGNDATPDVDESRKKWLADMQA